MGQRGTVLRALRASRSIGSRNDDVITGNGGYRGGESTSRRFRMERSDSGGGTGTSVDSCLLFLQIVYRGTNESR
jgi:hypothetical protein